jgi:putative ABC transport system ATP-binding protein
VLTAYENVELPLLLTRLSKAERRQHVETALALVGLEDRMHHFPRQLSGGQEQRVAIARAIATDPTILVADEPTGDLDETTADSLHALLREMHAEYGLTSVIATHNPRLAAACDRVLRLELGQLRAA